METFYGAIVAAVIGSVLIVINEWIKIFSEHRKQKKKFNIWKILELTEQASAAPNLTVEQVSENNNRIVSKTIGAAAVRNDSRGVHSSRCI